MTSEHFISLKQIVEAAVTLGLVPGEEGFAEVADIVGPMTGLDMSRYYLRADFNARGWFIERRDDG